MGLWDQLRGLFRPSPKWAPGMVRENWHFVDDAEWVGRLPEGDDAVLLVYADWLEEKGDGRAELLSRARRSEDLNAFVEANAKALFGSLAPQVLERHRRSRRPLLEPKWSKGLLRGAAIRTERPWEDAEAFLRLPVARHLEALSLGLAQTDEVQRLAGGPRFTTLFLGDFEYPDECEMSWAELGDLSGVWAVLPWLRDFTARGLVESLGSIDAPALTRFVRETSGLKRAELQAVCEARWPRLEHLELWFGDENYGAECGVSDVEPLLELPWPSLRTLALRNFTFTDELLKPLLRAPVSRRLRRLDLSLGCLTDQGAELLLAARAQLSGLAELDLSQNLLSEKHLAELATLCPKVDLDHQRLDDVEGDRYVAVAE